MNSSIINLINNFVELRNDKTELTKIFKEAYITNPDLTIKALLYLRDIREGQGERDNFRYFINYISNIDSDIIKKYLTIIPKIGRWDDLYTFINTPLNNDVLEIMKQQFNEDLKSPKVSLLGKWLKSENSKDKELSKITRKYFKLSPKNYRLSLTKLRKMINENKTIKTLETFKINETFKNILFIVDNVKLGNFKNIIVNIVKNDSSNKIMTFARKPEEINSEDFENGVLNLDYGKFINFDTIPNVENYNKIIVITNKNIKLKYNAIKWNPENNLNKIVKNEHGYEFLGKSMNMLKCLLMCKDMGNIYYDILNSDRYKV